MTTDVLNAITLVPKSMTSNSRAEGRFDKQDFIYIAEDAEYRYPAGQRAIWRFTTVEDGLTIHKYWTSAYPRCPPNRNARPASIGALHGGSTVRSRDDAGVTGPQARRDASATSTRSALKMWMGATHFLTKTLPRVSAEMSPHVLAYNMKRVMQILGFGETLRVLRA